MSKARILLVEDEESFRELIALACKERGYEPIQAANGIEAIKLLEKEKLDGTLKPVDVILSDLNMPKISGIEMIACLKASNLVKNSHFIVVSGLVDGDVEERLESLGVAEIVSKPLRVDELLDRVAVILEEKRSADDPKKKSQRIEEVFLQACDLEAEQISTVFAIEDSFKVSLEQNQLKERNYPGLICSMSTTCFFGEISFSGFRIYKGKSTPISREDLSNSQHLGLFANLCGSVAAVLTASFESSCQDSRNREDVYKIQFGSNHITDKLSVFEPVYNGTVFQLPHLSIARISFPSVEYRVQLSYRIV